MQTILLAITKFLPGALQVQWPQTRPLGYFVVQSILEASDFPRDFPLTAESVMRQLVECHMLKALTKAAEQFGSIDEALDWWHADSLEQILDEMHDTVSPYDPIESSMYFWIDALCINQQDRDERSQQVGRMKDIYSNAPSLLIWLGDVPESSAEGAMSLIHDIQTVAWPYLEGSTEDMDLFSSEQFVQPRVSAVWKLMEVLSQSWFFRMWIIQEVATATGSIVALVRFQPVQWKFLTHVVFACCRQMLSSSDDLQPELFMATSHDEILKIHLELTNCYHRWIQKARIERDGHLDENVAQRLKQLLRCSKGRFNATEPHDLLYALLGLLGTNNIPRELSPNYATSFNKVFHQYAMYIIKHTNGLGFLPSYKWQLDGVPSWVPDWRYCIKDQSDINWISSSLSYAGVSTDWMRLEVDGINLGEVIAVVHPGTSAAITDNEFPFSLDAPYGTDNDDDTGIERHILVTVWEMQKLKRACLESLRVVSPGTSDSTFQNQWEKFWPGYTNHRIQTQVDMVEGGRELELAEIVQGVSGVYFVVLAQEIRSLSQKGIAILDGGKLVSTVRQDEPIRRGDTICVLKGMNGPCILRQEGSCYRFLGECGMTSLEPSILEKGSCGTPQKERFILV